MSLTNIVNGINSGEGMKSRGVGAHQFDAQTEFPDQFFTATQIQRLQELKQRFQTAEKPFEDVLSVEEQQEFKALLKAEIVAATRRTAALLANSGS